MNNDLSDFLTEVLRNTTDNFKNKLTQEMVDKKWGFIKSKIKKYKLLNFLLRFAFDTLIIEFHKFMENEKNANIEQKKEN